MRPNSGRIDAGQDVEVQVLLQAMKEDPPPDTKCKDKFLVQSVAIKAENDSNVSQIWSNIEQNAKSSIQEKKIRVTFLSADSSSSGGGAADVAVPAAAAAGGAAAAGAAAAVTNGVESHDDEPPSYSSPSPPAEKSIDASDTAAESSTVGTAAIPTSQEDLKAQLEEAKATIARLQAQSQDYLRQRKPQEAAEKAITSVQQTMENAPGGVPVQIVAGLCLLCFLIAWLFF